MPDHTPTPYELGVPRTTIFASGDDDRIVAECEYTSEQHVQGRAEREANARFIVTACNAHETLRASLELIARGGTIDPAAAKLLLIELGIEAAHA